jgi:hypothetical protein
MITDYARCSPETKSRISMENEYSKARLSTTNELDLGVKLVKCYICNIALYGAENLALREEGKKFFNCDAGGGLGRSVGPIV